MIIRALLVGPKVSILHRFHHNNYCDYTSHLHKIVSLPLTSDSPCWHHSSLLLVLPFGLTDSVVEQVAPNMTSLLLTNETYTTYHRHM